MLTAIVIFLYIFMLIDYKYALKDCGKKAKLIYCGCLAISFLVLILFTIGISLPSPTILIRNAIDTFIQI